MGEAKVQGHIVSPTSYWLPSFSFHVSLPILKIQLFMQGEGHSSRSHGVSNVLSTLIPFHVNQPDLDPRSPRVLVNIGSCNGMLPDGTKPLPEPTSVNFLSKHKISHLRNTFENVDRMGAILFRTQWVKKDYIMAGHAIVVAKDITLLFYHGNAVILTLW